MKQCLNCERTEADVPLISLAYRDEIHFICPQCLPVLIHKPQNLTGKLEGADQFAPTGHDE
jgi:hypothetical protein